MAVLKVRKIRIWEPRDLVPRTKMAERAGPCKDMRGYHFGEQQPKRLDDLGSRNLTWHQHHSLKCAKVF